jgi:hypothetical protein
MRIRLALLGVEVLDFATGDHVLDSYGEDTTPKIPAVYGHAAGTDVSPPTERFGMGFSTGDDRYTTDE